MVKKQREIVTILITNLLHYYFKNVGYYCKKQ